MRAAGRVYTQWPWCGSHRIPAMRMRQGVRSSRKRVQQFIERDGVRWGCSVSLALPVRTEERDSPLLAARCHRGHANQPWRNDIMWRAGHRLEEGLTGLGESILLNLSLRVGWSLTWGPHTPPTSPSASRSSGYMRTHRHSGHQVGRRASARNADRWPMTSSSGANPQQPCARPCRRTLPQPDSPQPERAGQP
jgi:hypothetical protein